MILKQSGGAFPRQTPFGQLSACAFLAQILHQPLPPPRQMPDSGGESEQLLAGPPLCAPQAARPPPARCRASRLPARRFIFPGPLACSKARFIVSRRSRGRPGPGAWPARARGPGARSPWGAAGPAAAAREAPSCLRGPVYSPERCKSVSPSRSLHLFLHLLQLLV